MVGSAREKQGLQGSATPWKREYSLPYAALGVIGQVASHQEKVIKLTGQPAGTALGLAQPDIAQPDIFPRPVLCCNRGSGCPEL